MFDWVRDTRRVDISLPLPLKSQKRCQLNVSIGGSRQPPMGPNWELTDRIGLGSQAADENKKLENTSKNQLIDFEVKRGVNW